MKIPGCKTRTRHCFVGKRSKNDNKTNHTGAGTAAGGAAAAANETEKLQTVRHDFYQTASAVMASLYLKKIDKDASRVEFASPSTVELDLHTADRKVYATTLPLYGRIQPDKSTFRILGTKLELTLVKADDGAGWPVLRSDERPTGEIIQTGRAGTAV